QSAKNRYMFINRFEASYLFSDHFRMVHEIIVQAVRRGTFAVAGWGGKMLCNPPWFVTKLAVESGNSCPLSAAVFGFDGQNILTEPSQELWVNLRADILSQRIFCGSFKFPFEFDVTIRIEFENEAFAVS